MGTAGCVRWHPLSRWPLNDAVVLLLVEHSGVVAVIIELKKQLFCVG
jgi:hypothetical protein